MNFFELQDQARQKTWLLIALFSVAVLCIIGLAVVLITVSFWGFGQSTAVSSSSGIQPMQWNSIVKTAISIIAMIGCVIIYKRLQLSQGGSRVAEMLGGRPIEQGTETANEQQLLNVVEEMAIAAGLPVPPVYVLEETTINAFAAGFSESDAVLGVTRGTLERLSRDQIQGIIGHEFSHVLHGDMRLNLNLITILAGIIFISQAGRLALYSTSRSRSNNRARLPVLGIGIGLMVIGSIGTFFGSIIKSAVNRQREYLADALTVIGSGVCSNMGSPSASECSHLFFGDAMFLRAFGFLSTHPPLEKRILRIQPNWDGRYLVGKQLNPKEESSAATAKSKINNLVDSLRNTGFLDPIMMGIASVLMQSLPKDINNSTHTPGSTYALMLALRLDKNETIQEKQLAFIESQALLLSDVKRYAKNVEKLSQKGILPIIEMSISALKRLSTQQYSELKQHLTQFIFADKNSDLQEWLHFRLLSHYLDPHFSVSTKKRFARSYHSFSQIRDSLTCVISLLANEAHDSDKSKDAAYSKGMQSLNINNTSRITVEQLEFIKVNKSIEKIDYLVPLLKDEFLTACANCIEQDNSITPSEWGLLRVIATCIGCPMPIVNRPD